MPPENRLQKQKLKRVIKWVNRWSEGNPFSAFTVFVKETKEFVGYCISGLGDNPGESEISYIFEKNNWGKGYGKEASQALVHSYLPLLRDMEFKTDSVAFRLLKATSRVDNPASSKILRSVGMKFIKSEEKFGALREHFEKQIFTRPVDLIAKLCESPTDSELKLLIEKTLSSKEG